MILPDVNVLIYAFRQDSPFYPTCNGWLTGVIAARSPFGISPLSLSAVVRITTNARSFREPSTLDEAFAFCDYLTGQPNCRLIEPGEHHWEIFQRVCVEGSITGSRVSDAWYAALAIEHGCEWITLDRDFARFPGLRSRAPAV